MKPKNILLIEDNPDDVALTRRALKKANVLNELTVAKDGAEALDLLLGANPIEPGLVLLDLKLPKVSGLELLPVVILTSSREESDVISGYSLGANSYVRKPVDFNQFADAVQKLGLYWLVLNEPVPAK